MNWQKRFGVELIAVIVMIAVVSVLAVYQYRWTGEISRTEQARLRNSLATSVRNFDQEFSYDFPATLRKFRARSRSGAIRGRIPRGRASKRTGPERTPMPKLFKDYISGRRVLPMSRHWNPSVKLTIASKMQPGRLIWNRCIVISPSAANSFLRQSMTAKLSTIRGHFSGTRLL